MSKDLTTRQRELLDFIVQYQNQYAKIPMLPVMAEQLKVSIPRIQHIISALTRKKFIERQNIYLIKSATTDAGAIPEKESNIGNTGEGLERPLNIN